MFDKLTERLAAAVEALRGRGRVTEDNIADTLRQVRMALIEADVAVPVVKALVDAVKVRALGAEVQKSLTPGQVFIKILHDELVTVMGEPAQGLGLRAEPPVVVLLAGLQGSGKTTTAAKLARLLMGERKKRVLLASTDIYRPAAITQLERLSAQIGAGFVTVAAGEAPLAIAARSLAEARRGVYDVLIVDTAGRLHVDAQMMAEVQAIDALLKPHERLFIVDSMAGQDAVNAARAFNAALDLTGIILTKADGDARGGAALSVRQVTGKPILYLGVGEKVEALELFHPERVASRILGMGDVLSLVEQVQRDVDRDKAAGLAQKLAKGKSFDFNDLREQMLQLEKMGGVGALLDKLPGKLSQAAAQASGQFETRQVKRQIAMINSMTREERRKPMVIDGSRKRRIANGAGVQVQDVNRLLRQFLQMQKVMKQFSKGGLRGLMRTLGGRLPPGLGP
ncbi:MAG TPA: signal recognition particle protein [Steroidobacteraceae bacterium]|nr:signal recognition particle protein [Steroidobacteraceae bacterium]